MLFNYLFANLKFQGTYSLDALGCSLTLNMNGVLLGGVAWCFPNDISFEVVIIFHVFVRPAFKITHLSSRAVA